MNALSQNIAQFFSSNANNRIEIPRILKAGALLLGHPKLQKRAKFLSGATSLGECVWVVASLTGEVSDYKNPEKTSKEKVISIAGLTFYLMEAGMRAYNSCLVPLYKWDKAGKKMTALGDFGGLMCGLFMMKSCKATYFAPEEAVKKVLQAKKSRDVKLYTALKAEKAEYDASDFVEGALAAEVRVAKVVAALKFTFGAAYALLEGAVLINTFELLGKTKKIPAWVILASSAVMLFTNIGANYVGQSKTQ